MLDTEIRGGICHLALCHAKANNRYVESYNLYKGSSYLTYLDNEICMG